MANGEKKNKKLRAKKAKKAVLMPTKQAIPNPSIKKNTSLRLEQSTLKQLKIRAIEEDTSVQQLLEMLVNDYLNK